MRELPQLPENRDKGRTEDRSQPLNPSPLQPLDSELLSSISSTNFAIVLNRHPETEQPTDPWLDC
ncbi:MAG: hypothetical protein WBB29_23060 [Geitlerinemataceae cyanobacterium]